MTVWIDISSPNGSRVGPGPLITATGWQMKRALDRAGDGSFSLPAADPRAAYLQAFRTVRAWDMVDGAQMELGAFTIKRTEQTISATGADMLTVSGPDLLEELGRVAVGDLQVFDVVTEHPSTALWLTGIYHHELEHYSAAPVTMTNALDGAAGDTATFATVNIDSNAAAIEIRATRAFHGLQLRFGPNVNMAAGPELFLSFWDPAVRFSPLHGLGDWVALSGVEDGTNRAAEGAEPYHLGQDGTIFFTAPAEWVAVGGYYRLRITGDDIGFSVTGNLDIADIAIIYETPTATALAKIMAFAPAGWSLDATHGLTATENTVYWQAAGESVLECLIRVAELTGEHFALGYSGKQVIWWGTLQEVAPLRAVGGPGIDGLAIADNANVCLITSLSEVQDAYSLATRVTPSGSGTGDARITLADISDPLPAGYALDGETLVRSAAEAALGRIEKRLDCPDVEATDVSLEQRQYAANTLLKQAYEWLRVHSATDTNRLTGDLPRAYTLTVVKADRVLWPNHQLRTVYRAYRDGVLVWNIDRLLTILSATTEYGADGLRTVALEVATVQAPLDNDAIGALQVKRDARAMRAHGVAPVGTVLAGPSSGLDMTGLTQAFDAAYTPASHALDTAASQHVGGVGIHTHAGPSTTGGPVAHSATTGLTTGDDHTQYLTPARHTTIGDAAPHHAAVTLASPDHGLGLTGQVITLGTPSTLTSTTTNAVTTTTHTHAITAGLGLLGNGTAQYQTIVTGATPFTPAFSGFLLDGTAGGKTVLAVTNTKTLTLTATDDYNLTIPATGTAALLATANTFTAIQTINVNSAASYYGLNINRTLTNCALSPQGLNVTVTATADAANAYTYYGMEFLVKTAAASAANWSGAYIGLQGYASHYGSGAMTSAYGGKQGAQLYGAGGITNAYGVLLQFNLGAVSGGSMTYAYDAYLSTPNKTAGATGNYTNSYGLYVADHNVATTLNYAIYTNAGLNRLGDQAAIVGSADRQQLVVTGHSTQAVGTGLVGFARTDAAAGVSRMLTLTALGSGADGDGGSIVMLGKSSTTAAQAMGRLAYLWNVATHASRRGQLDFYVSDYTAERTALTLVADGVAGITRQIAAQEGAYATTAVNLTLTSVHHWVKVTAACTITLPTAVGCTGREYIITATADNVIVDGAGSETISSELTQTLLAGDTMQIKSDNAAWWAI